MSIYQGTHSFYAILAHFSRVFPIFHRSLRL
eukprot:COSAG04_NODE_24189_length_325_cov_1.287611_2_plen_30_part_01